MLIKELAAQRVCLYLILQGRLDHVLDQEEVLPFVEMERPTKFHSSYQIVPCLQCSLTEILIKRIIILMFINIQVISVHQFIQAHADYLLL